MNEACKTLYLARLLTASRSGYSMMSTAAAAAAAAADREWRIAAAVCIPRQSLAAATSVCCPRTNTPPDPSPF